MFSLCMDPGPWCIQQYASNDMWVAAASKKRQSFTNAHTHAPCDISTYTWQQWYIQQCSYRGGITGTIMPPLPRMVSDRGWSHSVLWQLQHLPHSVATLLGTHIMGSWHNFYNKGDMGEGNSNLHSAPTLEARGGSWGNMAREGGEFSSPYPREPFCKWKIRPLIYTLHSWMDTQLKFITALSHLIVAL